MNASALVIALRSQGIRVRLDGETVRCKSERGPIPGDLAQQIRALKPQLLELLTIEQHEIDRRVDAIGAGLLADRPERTPSLCAWCGAAMPSQQSGKCVSCCLAAAHLLEQRWRTERSTGQPTYPISVDSGKNGDSWDMTHDGGRSAA